MPTYFKILVFIALTTIVYNLARAFYHLFSQEGNSRQVAKALTLRVGLSFCLFLLLLLAYAAGIIQPHGV